jgi:superfamily I DNA and/or RNA helicase
MPMIERSVVERLEEEMPDAPRSELVRSDFERAHISSFGKANGQMLTEQYRMAPAICDMISKVFYEPHDVRLRTSPNRAVDALFSGSLPKPLSSPITWVDTSSDQRHMEERAEWNRHSFWNPAEVEAVLKILERIAERDDLVRVLTAGSSETPIGVICMYSAQKAKIVAAAVGHPFQAARPR